MKFGGITLFICGIFLLGLSGLEMVLIYVAGAISFKSTSMEALKNLTPPYIWNSVNFTLILGIILCFAGLVVYWFNYDNKKKSVN